MSQEKEPISEQVLESQASRILGLARRRGYEGTSWDVPTLIQALELFSPIFRETSPLTVFAEIGLCTFREECDEECGLPNTLTLRTILEEVDAQTERRFYEAESKWLDREDSNLRRVACHPTPITVLDDVGQGYWRKQMESTFNRVKIYPL